MAQSAVVKRGRTSRAEPKLALAIGPPFPPMEAQSVEEAPKGAAWQYEPKWDGFRCLAFRAGNVVYLQSKSGQPLARYFPDVAAALVAMKPRRFVLDGEIVIPIAGRLSFDELLLRVHPAESRVRKLAAAHPAMFIAFDLLVDERNANLALRTLAERRPRLERFARFFGQAGHDGQARQGAVRLSPATTELSRARRWFRSRGANLDGIIAKRLDLPYQSGSRDGMQKIKHRRTADCLVGGYRLASSGDGLGSLLLGLYNDEGLLDHVGFTSSFTRAERKAIAKVVMPLAAKRSFTGKAPGGPSRWSTRESDEWQPVAPKLVAEVEYDHFSGNRFRHGTKFLRWRPDKKPSQCTFDQVEPGRGSTLALLD